MAQATCELQWLQFLFADFGLNFSSPTLLYCGNKATLHIAANHVFHEWNKHIELDFHFIQEKNQVGLIKKIRRQILTIQDVKEALSSKESSKKSKSKDGKWLTIRGRYEKQ